MIIFDGDFIPEFEGYQTRHRIDCFVEVKSLDSFVCTRRSFRVPISWDHTHDRAIFVLKLLQAPFFVALHISFSHSKNARAKRA